MNGLKTLFRGENNYDFVRSWRYGLIGSAALVAISVLLLAVRGLSLGLDFNGGTAWDVPTSSLSVSEVRDTLRPLGEAEAKIQTIGGDLVRVQSGSTDNDVVTKVRDALAEKAQITADQVAVTTVGPSWGDEISKKAIRALVLFLIAIAIYITFALRDWRMAVGALVAVGHDIIISVGFYALLQIEVTPATVIAFLTILGFSLYDTVVVYARIKDNSPMVSVAGRMTYTEMASLSLNQVLMRSINTSLTAIIPVLSILVVGSLIFGATTLEEFGVALLVGLVVGVYSSIFVATPIVAYLNERSATYRNVRLRLAEKPAGPSRKKPVAARSGAAPSGAPDAAGSDDATATEGPRRPVTATRTLPAGYSASHPPRPRKNKRR